MSEIHALSLKTKDFGKDGSAFYKENHGYFYPYFSSRSEFEGLLPEALVFDNLGIYRDEQAINSLKRALHHMVEYMHTFVWVDAGIREPEAVIDPIVMGAQGVVISSPYASWPVIKEAAETLEYSALGLFLDGELLLGDIGRDVYAAVEKAISVGIEHVMFFVLYGEPEIRHALRLVLNAGLTPYVGYAMSDPREKMYPFDLDGLEEGINYIIPYRGND